MGEYHIARDGKTYSYQQAIVDCYDPVGHALQTGVSLEGDIEIGAVEIKDATSTARAVVKSDGTNNALVVVQNAVPTTTVQATNLDVRDLASASDSVSTVVKALSGRPASFEDANFLTGDSPATLDVNTALGRNGVDGYVVNDGDGNFTVAVSNNGTNFSGEITLKEGDVMSLTNLDVDTLRITWVANSAYRVVVV
jgi:hypothetical protein